MRKLVYLMFVFVFVFALCSCETDHTETSEISNNSITSSDDVNASDSSESVESETTLTSDNNISSTTSSDEGFVVQDYMVMNYVGLTYDEVKDELDRNGISYEVVYETTDDYEPGVVLDQSIAEGVVIAANSSIHTIELTISAEEDLITLADYYNLDYQQVYQSLQGLGLSVSVLDEVSEDVEPNHVIRTEPQAGTSVAPGSSVVIIYSIEPTTSVVSNLCGMNLTGARATVEEAGLTVGTIEGADEVVALPESQQYIILTDPPAGATVPRNSSVKIYVGTVEDVQRGGTPTPTPIPVVE